MSLIGAIAGFVLTFFVMRGNQDLDASLGFFRYALVCILGVVLSYLLHLSSRRLDKLIGFQRSAGARLLLGILLQSLISYAIIYIALRTYSAVFEDVLNFSVSYQNILVKTGILVFISIILYAVIYFAFYSYNSYTVFQIASVKQERKQIELQLKALKSQLSPHFLFNSLNAISSLLYKDVSMANKFIRKLAELYQYTLNSYSAKLVSVQEELDFVHAYLFLQETRFRGALKCQIEVPDQLQMTKIPPLALQMLVENAVKHNQFSETNPLHISIRQEGDFISVRNNKTAPPGNVKSFHIGLKNINSRYLLLTGSGIQISNGQEFQVNLPIVR